MPIPSNKVKPPYEVGMGHGSHKPDVTGAARTQRYNVPHRETPGNPVPRGATKESAGDWNNMHTAVHPGRQAAVLRGKIGQAPPMTGGHGDGAPRPAGDRARAQAGKKR